MKVAIVTEYFHPVIGGINTQVESLAESLIGEGHEIVIHTSLIGPGCFGKCSLKQEIYKNIKIKRYPKIKLFKSFGSFFPSIEKGSDIVHLHDWYLISHLWVIFRYPNKKIVLTPHGSITRPTKIQNHPYLRKIYDFLLAKYQFNKIRHIVAVTEHERIGLINKFSYLKKKITVVSNGIEDKYFDTAPAYNTHSNYIITVGRLSKGGHKEIIKLSCICK